MESRLSSKAIQNATGNRPHGGKVEQSRLSATDYIANRYLTVTAGRFLTPSGSTTSVSIHLIRSLQPTPLLSAGNGFERRRMLRGGFSLNPK